MVCRSPLLPHRPRLAPPPVEPGTGIDVMTQVKELMRRAAADGSTMDEAMTTLDLLGEDVIAIKLWQAAAARGQAAAAARGAIGPLFRARLVDDFRRAWDALASPDDLDADMLWHLMAPRLNMADDDVLLALQASMRRCQPDKDLARLTPHLIDAFGRAYARQVIQRELDRAASPQRRRALEKLLGTLGRLGQSPNNP
jgi:hypothetical protein